MTQDTTRSLRCASHPVAADIQAAEAGESRVTCPVCGQADTLAFAQAEAAKAELGSAIADAVTRSSASDRVPPPPASPEPRWVFGGDEPGHATESVFR